jgi:hypothetical protein
MGRIVPIRDARMRRGEEQHTMLASHVDCLQLLPVGCCCWAYIHETPNPKPGGGNAFQMLGLLTLPPTRKLCFAMSTSHIEGFGLGAFSILSQAQNETRGL